jgi:hypothetical protein
MAYAAVSRAALYRSRGEMERGDTALREVITFGFQMIDNASTLIDELIGSVIVGIGQTALNTSRAIDGRPVAPEWEAHQALAKAQESRRQGPAARTASPANGPAELRRELISRATNPGVNRGLRLESYQVLALSPCTNLHELLMGPDADVREALANARGTLVRDPSDVAMLDLMGRAPVTILRRGADQAGVGDVLMDFARASSWLFHNPRIAGCVSILATEFKFPST